MAEKIKKILDKSNRNKVLLFLPAFLLVVLILLGLASLLLGGFSRSNIMGQSDSSLRYRESNTPSPMMDSYVQESSKSYSGRSSASTPAVDRKVIKNASLNILVTKVEETVLKIQTIAEKYYGLVDSSDVSNSGVDTKYGNVTIRVPNTVFNVVIAEVKGLAVKVNSEKISSSDVTAQYVDMDARLRSKKAVEAQYVELLKQTKTVEEIVAVNNYLNNVREEIERLQSQINYLSEQVSMSTINISLTSEPEVQIMGITWHPLTVLRQSFRDLLVDLAGIVDAIIAFVVMLPGLLIKIAIFIGAIWIGIKILVVLYKKFIKDRLFN